MKSVTGARRATLWVMACALGLAGATTALGHGSVDGAIDNAKATHGHQHGESDGHLPPAKLNVEVVSKLQLKNVVPEKIADVGVHKGYAYLAAWGSVTCKYNGVHVVDIRNPAAPKEVSFVQAKEGSYPGEGVQALSISTPKFTGDILVTNNEICKDKTGFGGMNIYNISNPANPSVLAEGVGDFTVNGQGKKESNEIHSVFAWDAGDKAYAVIVDNEDQDDVDILDITDPRKATVIKEIDLDLAYPQISQKNADTPNLGEIFLHDMIVKEINGRQIMSASYWDGGYVLLDVTDLHKEGRPVTYVADSDFPNPDTELPTGPDPEDPTKTVDHLPEGNAHQSEFTKDNRYLIGADEDFSPHFSRGRFTADGPSATRFFMSQGLSENPHSEGVMIGDTYYGGRACTGDPAVPSRPATEPGTQIAVVTRGLCTFTEKVANVVAAGGYEAVVVVNREGTDACVEFGMAVTGEIPPFAVARKIGYDIFDVPNYNEATCNTGAASLLPGVTLGQKGKNLTITSTFDGWGYVRLFKAPSAGPLGTGLLAPNNGITAGTKLEQVDTFSIEESRKVGNSHGVGDLSVHEVAVSEVDPSLAYFSYYSAGLQVMKVQNDQLVEAGEYIHNPADGGDTGNNLWGVQVFQQGGQEYVAASDRDSGLWIFKYTPGPTP